MSGPIDQINSIGKLGQIGNEGAAYSPNPEKRSGNKSENPAAQNAKSTSAGTVDRTALDKAIEKANEALNKNNVRRQFVKDDDVKGHLIVKLVNEDTNEVVRQIPSEEAIKISKNIETMLGMFLDNKI